MKQNRRTIGLPGTFRRIAVPAVAIAVAAVTLTACNGKAGGGDDKALLAAPAVTSGTPVKGGTLVFSDVAPIASWQTQAIGSYTAGNTLNSVLDRLTYFDPDQRELVPWLATKWTVNPAATEFSFTLRSGVTFSDGTPLTAQVVKDNFDLWGKGDKGRQILPSRYVPNYDHAVADGNTVKVFLTKPNGELLYATSSVFLGIVGEKTLKLPNVGQAQPQNVVGSGPFVFISQVPDQEWTLGKRKDYAWPPATSANQGAAYLDKIVIKVIPEVGLRSGALTSGQVQIARGVQPNDEKVVRAAGDWVQSTPGVDLTANFASFRIANPYVSDVRVRRALLIGFDRADLSASVLSDSFPPPKSVLDEADPDFVDLSSELAYNLPKAKQLLDEAGWKVGSGGLRYKDGKVLQLTIPDAVQQPAVAPTWEYIEQQWRTDLGVKITVREGDPAFATAATKDVKVGLVPTRTWLYNGLASIFTSPAATTILAKDPKLSTLNDKLLSATTPAARKAASGEIQKYLIDNAYVIPTSEESQVFAGSPKVHIDFASATYPVFQSAWVEK
jgi:peptide/nickel transport system substrate-binding protein